MVERKSPYDGKVVSRVPVCGEEDAKRALEIAKERGLRVYLSLYAEPRNRDLPWLEEFLKEVAHLPLDGIEVHNLGLVRMVSRLGLSFPIHLGVYANLYTHETAKLLYGKGVVRVFPNPESP
jgi:putative protease